jgi:hypothetical protein
MVLVLKHYYMVYGTILRQHSFYTLTSNVSRVVACWESVMEVHTTCNKSGIDSGVCSCLSWAKSLLLLD